MSGMTHEEILRDAKEMAVHYPDDRLKFTGREILDFVAPFEARISTLEQALRAIENADPAEWAAKEPDWASRVARAALSGASKEPVAEEKCWHTIVSDADECELCAKRYTLAEVEAAFDRAEPDGFDVGWEDLRAALTGEK